MLDFEADERGLVAQDGKIYIVDLDRMDYPPEMVNETFDEFNSIDNAKAINATLKNTPPMTAPFLNPEPSCNPEIFILGAFKNINIAIAINAMPPTREIANKNPSDVNIL